MKSIRLTISLIIISILCTLACKNKTTKAPSNQSQTLDIQWKSIATKIAERSDLHEGEKVLLVAMPGLADELVDHLIRDVKSLDADYLGTLSVGENQPEEWATEFTSAVTGRTGEELENLLLAVDLGIMLPGATPAHASYKALQNILKENTRRTIHFHWSGAYDLNGNAIDVTPEKGKFYEKVLLNTDYEALAAKQRSFEEAMRGQRIQVTTPEGTDIHFEIGDRPVTKQDGNASARRMQAARNLIDREVELPAGAIRVAPVEETVIGSIVFPDAQWNGVEVTGLSMEFEKGKLTAYSAVAGEEGVEAELERAGNAGRSFREFALGFNPLMPIQTGEKSWIPYYGYGAGIVRLSLGDNTELGGNVGGGYVRWNFFVNATVKVGEEVWVEKGEMVK